LLISFFLSSRKQSHIYQYHRDPWTHHDGRRRSDFEEAQTVAESLHPEQRQEEEREKERTRKEKEYQKAGILESMAYPFDLDDQKGHLKSLEIPEVMASKFSKEIEHNFINMYSGKFVSALIHDIKAICKYLWFVENKSGTFKYCEGKDQVFEELENYGWEWLENEGYGPYFEVEYDDQLFICRERRRQEKEEK
jgi:hypothetical protein